MSGLYIHIPFCKSRCIYCGFYSTTLLSWQDRYVEALCREMQLRLKGGKLPYDPHNKLTTIYLGGGTPSQLSPSNLEKLFIYINKVYGGILEESEGRNELEITMECNPDDINDSFCDLLRRLPVNRISMGAQTFSDERLRFLHRRHSSHQVGEAVSKLRAAGINNISIDLMFGFPGETLEEWENDIKQAIKLQVEHISAYSLMYEEGTPLYELSIRNPQFKKTDEDVERSMYETLIDHLEAAGFEHYEISNFALPGRRSKHNSSYWQGIPYMGIGAAAHSYDLKTRSWNVADLRKYIESIEQGELPQEVESIDETTRYNDLITTTLRTREGILTNEVEPRFRDYLLKNAQPHIDRHLLTLEEGRLHLTREGLFVSDDIMSDLVFV